MKNFVIQLLTSNIHYEESSSYRRIILVNFILILTTVVFGFFSYLNFFILQSKVVALLDIGAGLVSFYTFFFLRKSKRIELAAKIASVNIILFFISFVLANGNDHYGLIWSIFIPIFTILINGRTLGLYFSLLFYAIVFPIAYLNIGIWQEGYWAMHDFVRYVVSTLVLIFITYMNEYAQELSDQELKDIRDRERARLTELQELSITDSLTGLYNRRYFNEIAPKLLSLAQRKQQYLSFFIVDIDNFKDYNDYYGHNQGDKVLEQVAHTLKEHIQRDDDFVFRLGGEEFAGMILTQEENQNAHLIEQLCQIIEELKLEHSYSDTSEYITISAGIRTISPKDHISIEELYRTADAELYKAKASGKNRIFLYSDT